MKIALFGYEQAGRKTLFALLTGRDVPAHHAATQPLEGVARVHDPRVDALTAIAKPKVTKFAELAVVLAPPVPWGVGSERGWIDALRRADLLCGVVRGFEADSVYHPAGSVDPARDATALRAELILADLERVETRLERVAREQRGGITPAQKLEASVLERCRECLEQERMLAELPLEPHEWKAILSLELVSHRPVLWAWNVAETGLAAPALPGAPFRFSGAIEREIQGMEDADERTAFLKDLGVSEIGSARLIAAAYDALGLMSFFTIGPDEVRAWTVRKGSLAPQAAGKVHSDIERGFIRAEVMAYDDLVACGSEANVKAQGKAQLRGKDYVVQDGDVCSFLFNV